MKNFYYTQYPEDMVFTDMDEQDNYFNLIRENVTGDVLSDADLKEVIDEKRKDFIENINYAPTFHFYPLGDGDSEYLNAVCKDFLDYAPFSPESVATMFASAYDEETYCYVGDRRSMLKFRQTFEKAVKKGLNVEQLKLALEKIYVRQKQDVKTKGKNSVYQEEINRTYNMLKEAERVCRRHSPYESLFKIGEQIAFLKMREDKLYKEPEEFSQADKELIEVQDQIVELKEKLKTECKKFDPKLLQNVVADKMQYIVEVDKEIATNKNQPFNEQVTHLSPEYRGLVEVGAQARFERERREQKNAGAGK